MNCRTLLLAALLSTACLEAQVPFDYYLLALSYAPDFCAEPGGNKPPQECGSGLGIGFVVHGLWPQNNTGGGPENCGPASPVSQSIINATLAYIPTPALIQHEWSTHGVCTGLDAASYFALVRKARDSVTIPGGLQPTQRVQLSPADIQSRMAAANPSFVQNAFSASCYRDQTLEEVRVCLNKDLSPRSCPNNVGTCTANTVTLLPVN